MDQLRTEIQTISGLRCCFILEDVLREIRWVQCPSGKFWGEDSFFFMRRSTQNFNIPPPPPPPSKVRAFELLKIGSFKFPPTPGQKGVLMLYSIIKFVCQQPSSEYVIIAVSDSGAKKKKITRNLHFGFNRPQPTGTKFKFPTSQAKRVVICPRFAWGGGGWDVKCWSWLAHYGHKSYAVS